ncbi:MAG: hypothetical protein ACREAG_00945 [Nitrosopumilaceae archaeon]
MTQINASINDELLKEFRHVIYTRMGLKKGDFKAALEDAMFDYVQKYSNSDSAKELAKRAQSQKDPESQAKKKVK